ncbi:hypothetical protein M3936_19225 [Sutcliffiella horikoshii]|uniref:hypothetical protein n=1 Tax=Sutcliffiella horikoshii TaxID=79883 RepID=UPI00203F91D0|nr:hypothetical protein [Sutcliffiella horikoshii]MCM3619705.1 hypothetical protein [Sutcliffiella horikoshii]
MFEFFEEILTQHQQILIATLLSSLGGLVIFILNLFLSKKKEKRDRGNELYKFSSGKIHAYNSILLSLKKALKKPLCSTSRIEIREKYESIGHELPIEIASDIECFIIKDVDNPFVEKKREKLLKKAILQLEKDRRAFQLINYDFVENEKMSNSKSRNFLRSTSWILFYYLLFYIVFLTVLIYLENETNIILETTEDGELESPFVKFLALSSVTLALLSIVFIASYSYFRLEEKVKRFKKRLKNKYKYSKEEYVSEGEHGYYICSICKKRIYLEAYDKFPICEWDPKHTFKTILKDTSYDWKKEKKQSK